MGSRGSVWVREENEREKGSEEGRRQQSEVRMKQEALGRRGSVQEKEEASNGKKGEQRAW